MTVQRMLRLSIVAAVMGLGLISCAYAQRDSENPCKNPIFGHAEEGFVNCKPEEAFERLNTLAKRGNPKALYMLSRIYDMGGEYFGLPQIKRNGDLTMQYLLKSAEGGYAKAQAALGVFYWRDYRETRERDALYWECRAAAQNDYEGIVNIKMHIVASGQKQTISQFCVPILKSPPKDKN